MLAKRVIVITDSINSSLAQVILPSSRHPYRATIEEKASSKFRPIAVIPALLKICENFILAKPQSYLEKSNDSYQFTSKKTRITFADVGLLAHTIAKSPNGFCGFW